MVVTALVAGDEMVFLLGSREIAGTSDIEVFSPTSPLGAAINGPQDRRLDDVPRAQRARDPGRDHRREALRGLTHRRSTRRHSRSGVAPRVRVSAVREPVARRRAGAGARTRSGRGPWSPPGPRSRPRRAARSPTVRACDTCMTFPPVSASARSRSASAPGVSSIRTCSCRNRPAEASPCRTTRMRTSGSMLPPDRIATTGPVSGPTPAIRAAAAAAPEGSTSILARSASEQQRAREVLLGDALHLDVVRGRGSRTAPCRASRPRCRRPWCAAPAPGSGDPRRATPGRRPRGRPGRRSPARPGAAPRAAATTPAASPPPPIGTITVATSGTCSTISSAMVP